MKQKIITLCGSAKFKKEFEQINFELSMQGHVVFSIVPIPSEVILEPEQKYRILCDIVHKRKIELSNSIFVINKNKYIGQSTRTEIDYAMKLGKEIIYLESPFTNNIKIVNEIN